jgi:hypothetical protein
MTVANLHDDFEHECPRGIGGGIAIKHVQALAEQAIKLLNAKGVNGLNQGIPLYPAQTVEAAFAIVGGSFKIDTGPSLSISIETWLHVVGKPKDRIVTFHFDITRAAMNAYADQTDGNVYVEPDATARPKLAKGFEYDNDRDAHLIAAGYVDATTKSADVTRFEQEVLYPFLWVNLRGMVRSIFRSIPLPQVLKMFRAFAPVPPIRCSITDDYLLSWTDEAKVTLEACGGDTGERLIQAQWNATTGTPLPWSPFDNDTPPIVLYISAVPLLEWHAGALKPGVVLSAEQSGFVSWGVYGGVGVQSLTVTLKPSSRGGTISANAELFAEGYATAWMNGPCGVRIDLIGAAFNGPGHLTADVEVKYDDVAKRLRGSIATKAELDASKLNLTPAGLLVIVYVEVLEWLLKTGILRVDTSFEDRSELTMFDTLRLTDINRVSFLQRVGEGSVLLAARERTDDDRERNSKL